MADKEKKEEVTMEDLQKQIQDLTKSVQTLQQENKDLKESNTQKDLEIAKLSLGGIERKSVTKEVEDEDVTFDFDF